MTTDKMTGAPEAVAIATIATISARIAKGYALAPDEAEHIVRAVVRMLAEAGSWNGLTQPPVGGGGEGMKYRITIPIDGEAIHEVEAEDRGEAMMRIRETTQKEAPGCLCVSALFTLLYCGAIFEVIAEKEIPWTPFTKNPFRLARRWSAPGVTVRRPRPGA